MKRRLKVVLAMIVAAGLATASLISDTGAATEAPLQPIAFDHWQHVSKEDGPGLACADCHEYAGESAHATIPNIGTCMVCHESIQTESTEVQRLAAFAEQGKQPAWKRVFWIEDSAKVFFIHKPHIRAGIDCVACHGDVAQMRVVRREVDQSMGWCIECHRNQNASIDCYVCHR
jgi:hypothetical protein